MPTIENTSFAAVPIAIKNSHLVIIKVLFALCLCSLSRTLEAQLYPNPNDLHTGSDGAGSDLPDGSFDLVWEVAHGPDNYILTTLPSNLNYVQATVTGNCAIGAWVDPYPSGKWISFDFGETPPCEHNDIGDVDLFFKTEFSLPSMGPCNTPINGGWCLVLDYLADNQVYQIYVNGQPQLNGQAPNYNFVGFKYSNRETQELCNDWINGNNEIVVHVKSGPNAEGFLAQARIPIVPNATDPVCIAQDITVSLNTALDMDTIYFAQIDNGSYSPCNGFTYTLSDSIFDYSDLGDNLVQLTITDSEGNEDICDFLVTVLGPDCSCDNTAPIFDILPDSIVDINCNELFPPFQYLTATDDIDMPIILECVDVTVSLENDINPNDCFYNVESELYDIMVLQSCNGIVSITHDLPNQNDTTLFSYDFPIGENIILWTAVDSVGNTLLDTCYFTVIDNTAPEIFCPDNLIVTEGEDGNNDDIYFVQGDILDPTATDQCQNLTTLVNDINGMTTLNGEGFTVGTHTITWVATDTDGNSSSCMVELQVFEEGTIINNDSNGEQKRLVNQEVHIVIQDKIIKKRTSSTIRSAADEDGVTITTSVDPFTVDVCAGYEVTYRWTASDSCGNSASVIESFMIAPDTIPPIMICTDVVVNLGENGIATITPEMFDNGSMDECNWMDLSINVTDVDCEDIGQPIVVTLTGTDECGNVNTCQALLDVQDKFPPNIICPDDQIYTDSNDGNENCQHQYIGTGLDPLSIDDNCINNVSIFHDYSAAPSNTTLSGAVFPLGTTIVTWTVTDASGTTSSCTVQTIVLDDIAPECIDQGIIDIMISSNENITITEALLTSPYYDACGIASIIFEPSVLSCEPQGNVNVTATITDDSGNTIDCPIIFNVIADVDVTCELSQDTFYLSQDGIVELNADEIINISGGGCGVTYIPTINPNFFGCNNVFANAQTIDIFVNGELCGQDEIFVFDTIAPQLICPVENTVSCESIPDPYISYSEFIDAGGDFLDNCPLDFQNFTHVGREYLGSVGCQSTILDTYQISDLSGNLGICIQTIITQDTMSPILDCTPVFLTVTIDSNNGDSCSSLIEDNSADPTVSDNCSAVTLTHDYISAPSNTTLNGAIFPLGITTVLFTAIDECGNMDTCSQLIQVFDTQTPECLAKDIIINLDANGEYILSENEVFMASSIFDNCGIADSVVILPKTDFSCEDVGSNFQYQVFITDQSGNQSVCMGNITVQEGPNSALCVANDITINLDNNGQASIESSDIASSSSSSCGTVISTISQSTFDCSNIGDNIVLITTSNDFSTDTCSAIVTVNDTISPICNAMDITVNLDSTSIYCLTPSDFDTNIPPTVACTNITVELTPMDVDGDQVPDAELVIIDIESITFTSNTFHPLGFDFTLSFSPDASITSQTFDCNDLGFNEVPIYAIDIFGNISSCIAMIEVQDNNDVDICLGSGICSTRLEEITAVTSTTDTITPLDLVDTTLIDIDDLVLSFSQSTQDTFRIYDCNDLGANEVIIWSNNGLISEVICTTLVFVTDPQSYCGTGSLVDSKENTGLRMVSNSQAFFDNCGIDTVIFTPAKLSCDNIGDNLINITVIDNSGNTTQCSTTVTVENNMAPMCIGGDTIIQLSQLECEVTPVLNLPMGTDVCGGATTISYLLNGYQIGDVFPIGTTTIEYQVNATNGTSSTCQYDVTVLNFQSSVMSCQEINLSLDENCESEILPSMILTGSSYGCLDLCEVTLTDLNDNPIPNMLNGTHAGQTMKATVCCGDVCCWSYVHIEDKLPPQISCTDTVITCLAIDDFAVAASSFPGVNIIYECSPAEIILIDEQIMDTQCDDPNTIAQISRTYIARSLSGKESEPCTQVLSVQRLDIADVVFPNIVKLDCTEESLIQQDASDEVLGVPQIIFNNDTIPLYPVPFASCNLLVDYTDIVLIDTDCKKKIMRQWRVVQWHCSEDETVQFLQAIEVHDHQAPLVDPIADLTFSSATHGCTARMILPSPIIHDNCSNEFGIQIVTSSGIYDISEEVEIPVGIDTITYIVTDECNNVTTEKVIVSVSDATPPVTICDQFEVISIALDSVASLPALAIDAGSYDECGPVTFLIARMDDPVDGDTLIFRDKARFYCSDAGSEVMTVLQVTDASGNTNSCMVSVEVQDKVEGRLICPADITIDCDTGINEDNLSDQFGEVEVLDNCPGNLIMNDYLDGQLNACGSGQLRRIIKLEDTDGSVLDSCIQLISVTPANPFNADDIEWPTEEFIFDGCKDVEVPIEVSGIPVINSELCQLAGMRYEDQVFDFSIDGACQKIIRKWFVVDWCATNIDGSLVEYTSEQVIKINNIIDPEIDNLPMDTTFCSFEAGCEGITIENYLTANASDDCTIEQELLTSYIVYQLPYDNVVKFGMGLDADGYYEIGQYKVQYIVEDRCGNQVVKTTNFAVENCKSPTPYCLSGLAATLTAMDTSGNGQIDAELLMLDPSFFDAGSYHDCGYDVVLSFSADTEDTMKVFDCSDIGEQEVQIWVTDPLGNQDYCVTSIDVQDNDNVNFCDDGELNPVSTVQGRIYTEMDEPLSQSMVYVQGDMELNDMTEVLGDYAFTSLPMGDTYRIMPYNNDNPMNGVSTLDLVMIQRHILGLADLDSPYKLIAADINADDRLTASDLLALRKLILGVSTQFEENTSWRFVDESYNFEDASEPWEEPFPEEYDIIDLQDDLWIDFIAIKTGDVSGSAIVNSNAYKAKSETRNSENTLLNIQNRWIDKGESIEFELVIDSDYLYYGMQIEIVSDGLNFRNIKSSQIDINVTDISKLDNKLIISNTEETGRIIRREKALLVIEVHAKASGYLSDMISIVDSRLTPEMYIGEQLEPSRIYLEWDRGTLEDARVFSVNQNTPNPWMSNTDITVSVSVSQKGQLSVFDILGRQIYQRDLTLQQGDNIITLTDLDLPDGGIYIYEVKSGNHEIQKKMLKVK